MDCMQNVEHNGWNSHTSNGNMANGDEHDMSDTEVPEIIKSFFPDISVEEFEQLIQQPLFPARQVAVCEECFLRFTEVEVYVNI